MALINVGSTVSIEFMFLNDGLFLSPDSITTEVLIYDPVSETYLSQATPETLTLTQISMGIYQADWVTSTAGRFKIEVLGEFLDVNISDILHEKYFLVGNTEPLKDLGSSYLVTFLGQLTPIYVDPEYVLQYYISGDIVEITEIIHRKSLELESKIGKTNLTEISSIQHDFVFAATMCELSRLYGVVNGGLSGFSSLESFQLGDLKVDKGSGGGRIASGSYDLGNAGSWCEVAALLKDQLLTAGGNYRPVVPGSYYSGVIPTRELKSSDL